ncbi:MAG: chaperonin GroEL [Anaerolineae bacterium]|nr:chaperonin GroEL [Anaerolineae bacterium]
MASRPNVLFGHQALADFRRGFMEMAELAAITYGPRAGLVVHQPDMRRDPEFLTDAATISRRIIQMPGAAQDAGAMLARHFIWKVRQDVGDGSALSAVLATSMMEETIRLVAAGYDVQMLRRGIDLAVGAVCGQLDQMAEPLRGEEDYAALATAITGNPALGKVIGEAVDLVGADGAITIEEFTAAYLEREYVEGARLKWGLVSSQFETDTIRHEAVLEHPFVYATSNKLQSARDIVPIINLVKEAGGKALLVVADQTQADALAVLLVNNQKGDVKCAAVKVEALGEQRVPSIEDVAVLTGGRVILAQQGLTADDVRLEDLGRARRVVIRKKETIIAGGAGSATAVRQRIRQIREELRKSDLSEDSYTKVRERLSHLSAGVAILKLGAFGEKERKALREQVENTLLVISASAEAGMVAGGGTALLACATKLRHLKASPEQALGVKVVERALEEPMRRLALSTGKHPPLIIEAARRRGPRFGYDVLTEKVVDMRQAGISDPVKVIKAALTSAASATNMTMTTAALVLHKKPDTVMEP